MKYEESENCPPEFLQKIEELILEKMVNLKEPKLSKSDKKYISQLANIFNWLQDGEVYKEMDAYKNSYCNEFLEILKNQIEFSKVYKDEEYIIKFKDILKYFYIFFSKNIKDNENKSKTKKQFKEKREELKKNCEENFKIVSLRDLFDETRKVVEVYIKNYKDQVKIMIKKGKNQEEIMTIFSKGLEKILKSLHKILYIKIELFNVKKIDELRYETIKNLKNKERIINVNFKDVKIKKEQTFYSILALVFSDLSNIEEKEWIESKERYIKAKKYLLPDEEVENSII